MKKARFLRLKKGDIVALSQSYVDFCRNTSFDIHQIGGALREQDSDSFIAHWLIGKGEPALVKILMSDPNQFGNYWVCVAVPRFGLRFKMWAGEEELEVL